MAIAQAFSGSNTISSTTVLSLTNNAAYSDSTGQTSDGCFQVFLDVSDMVVSDQLRIRIHEKVRSGDTQKICHEAYLTGSQTSPIWVSPSLIFLHGWDVSVFSVNGNSITLNWSIRQAG